MWSNRNNFVAQKNPLKPTESVLIYYIGHGVEYNQNLHAVLHNGENGRVKYDLEAKAS